MTTIYYAPDESHRFEPLIIQLEKLGIYAEPCAGLESETGGDFLISALPIDPLSNVKWHTDEAHSIPVNLKVGYDALNNSDQRHKFAARVQRLGFKVAFLLGVGSYRNKDGYLQVGGYKSNDKVPYTAFQQMKLNEVARGVTWDSIETLEDLPGWIKAAAKMMELPGKNIIFSKSQYPLYEWYDDAVSDPWQSMEEVSPESVQHILACGLPGFGPKRANSVVDYLTRNSYPVCLYTALAVLCQIDEKGKRVHKIPSIGAEYWKRARDWVFRCQTVDGKEDDNKLLTSLNLCLHTVTDENDFWRGARSALARFHDLFEKELKATDFGKPRPAKVAYNNAMQAALILVNEQYPARQLPNEEFPF